MLILIAHTCVRSSLQTTTIQPILHKRFRVANLNDKYSCVYTHLKRHSFLGEKAIFLTNNLELLQL